MMKLSLNSFLLALSLKLCATTVLADHCTFGQLYVSDTNTSNVYILDISDGVASADDIPSTAVETLQVPEAGAGEFRLKTSPSSETVAVSHYGDRSDSNSGGFFLVVDTGVHKESDGGVHYDGASLIANAVVDVCVGAAHVEFNDDTVTVFCDGYMPSILPDANFSTQVNTSLYVFDEDKYGASGETALIFSMDLPGAHHGVAYALDKRHLLYSLPLDDRVDRLTNNSLPSFFQVIDMDTGTVLHDMSDPNDKSAHCHGYHGSARLDGTFALACNDEHAGILLVDFVHSTDNDTYASRYLPYPTEHEDHRTGTIYSNYDDYMVANFANRVTGDFHIMAVDPTQAAIASDAVFTLPASQCLFGFEKSEGHVVYVVTPENATLHVLEWHDNHWDVVVQKAIVPGVTSCTELVATVGVHQVFVATKADRMLYVANVHLDDHDHRRRHLAEDHEDEIEVFSSQMAFVPNRMVVAGVPKGTACEKHPVSASDKTSGVVASVSTTTTTLVLAMVALVGMWVV